MPEYTIEKLTDALNIVERPIKNTPIALLGLSYKANVGDLRESPAIILKDILLEKQAATFVYDPYFPEYSNVDSLEMALEKSYAVLIATDHKLFKEKLTPEYLLKHNIRIVIDGKNCLDKENIVKAGILYKGIGT
jgi:UDP-N-acetyl-D-mannosaminuronate dehydrogenase